MVVHIGTRQQVLDAELQMLLLIHIGVPLKASARDEDICVHLTTLSFSRWRGIWGAVFRLGRLHAVTQQLVGDLALLWVGVMVNVWEKNNAANHFISLR